MQIAIRIAIILIALLLVRLIRKRIKRLIFILILLLIAFWIYWIFNPSGAARLRYNLKTLPQRINSIVSNQSFLDYDKYKASIKDKANITISNIWDTIDNTIDNIKNPIVEFSKDNEFDSTTNDSTEKERSDTNSKEFEETKTNTTSKTFSIFPTFKNKNTSSTANITSSTNKPQNTNKPENSTSNVLNTINDYIDKNLTGNNQILVTVEYSEWESKPQKIIMETIKQ